MRKITPSVSVISIDLGPSAHQPGAYITGQFAPFAISINLCLFMCTVSNKQI